MWEKFERGGFGGSGSLRRVALSAWRVVECWGNGVMWKKLAGRGSGAARSAGSVMDGRSTCLAGAQGQYGRQGGFATSTLR